jgi:fluoroacetyl-CoA thioesterase
MDVRPGAAAERAAVVTGADTAQAVGSGSLAVLGTPVLLAWCEGVGCQAVADGLAAGETTVGTAVHLEHLAASAVGDRVTVRAEVSAVEGRRLTVDVVATAEDGTVLARGTVVRVVVDTDRFLDRVGRG